MSPVIYFPYYYFGYIFLNTAVNVLLTGYAAFIHMFLFCFFNCLIFLIIKILTPFLTSDSSSALTQSTRLYPKSLRIRDQVHYLVCTRRSPHTPHRTLVTKAGSHFETRPVNSHCNLLPCFAPMIFSEGAGSTTSAPCYWLRRMSVPRFP